MTRTTPSTAGGVDAAEAVVAIPEVVRGRGMGLGVVRGLVWVAVAVAGKIIAAEVGVEVRMIDRE